MANENAEKKIEFNWEDVYIETALEALNGLTAKIVYRLSGKESGISTIPEFHAKVEIDDIKKFAVAAASMAKQKIRAKIVQDYGIFEDVEENGKKVRKLTDPSAINEFLSGYENGETYECKLSEIVSDGKKGKKSHEDKFKAMTYEQQLAEIEKYKAMLKNPAA